MNFNGYPTQTSKSLKIQWYQEILQKELKFKLDNKTGYKNPR